MASAYATRNDLLQLGLTATALQQVDTASQDAALAAASSLADSYLNARFTLPLRSYGKDLTRAVVHIAAYDLMVIRGYNPDSGSDVVIKERAQAAIEWLKSIAEGTTVPAVIDSTAGAATAAGESVSSAPSRGYRDIGDSEPGEPIIEHYFWNH